MKKNFLIDNDALKEKWKNVREIGLIEQGKKRFLIDNRNIKDLAYGDGRFDDQLVSKAVLGSKNHINCLRLAEVASWVQGDIVEFGTNLGVSSAYLALGINARSNGSNSAIVCTGDCSKARLNLAKELHSESNIGNIEYIHGYFEKTCQLILSAAKTGAGLAFIDGDHTYNGTHYLHQEVVSFFPNLSVMIFDDIDWSKDMRMAWDEIRSLHVNYSSLEIAGVGYLFAKGYE